MWLVEAMGVDAFRAAIEQRMGAVLRREVRLGWGSMGVVVVVVMAGGWGGEGCCNAASGTCVPQPTDQTANRSTQLSKQVHVAYDDEFLRRDVLGVHPQAQAGLWWAGACVPAGRMVADDFDALATAAET